MSIGKRDPHSGYLTTGHEWNGITELNTPVPKVVFISLIVTAAIAVAFWVLLPAWPLGTTYSKGLLGISQKQTLADEIKQARYDQRLWSDRIEAMAISDIQSDTGLMQTVRETARTLYADNCAACHRGDARGGPGFPNLTGQSWLWGSEPEAMLETLRVGINAAHNQTRNSQMPAFGRDKLLRPEEIATVISFVQTLNLPTVVAAQSPEHLKAGRGLYDANCASCHGPTGIGNKELGARSLVDPTRIYGADTASLYETVWGGRQGQMPSWEGRLTPVQRKLLVLYLLDLRVGEK